MLVIIVGAGKLGYKIAEAFSQEDNNLIVIDSNPEVLERVANSLDALTIKGNGLDISILKQADITKCDLLIAVTSNDEVNILVSTIAKKLGCKKVIARIRNPEYASQVGFIQEQMEIDFVANPDWEMAREVAKYLLESSALHMGDYAEGRVVMDDFRVHELEGYGGKTLRDIQFPQGVLVAAVLRDNQLIIPHGDIELADSDVIYMIGTKEGMEKMPETVKDDASRLVRSAMILGGGRVSYHLARLLLQNGVAVKIIEQDQERCDFLAENLRKALIIRGDVTDMNLLTEENLAEVDALVSLTGFDEENILLALSAQQFQIPKVIAKVSRPNYVPIIEQLGVNVVNPILIMASEILRYIQGGRVVSVSLLLGGEAEVLEIIAQPQTRVVGKPLKDIGLPKGIIIGSLVHNGQVVIPHGDTVIEPEDRMIVFCIKSELVAIKKYFYQPTRGFLSELWNRD
ncbi:MAG: Trk system potassium transporter TrkA [Firmicutes bacterium]|jgi:trk system potassium uptake protein TrkA|nr:Trk system potassium transporter TrkA [Bacillota bacterium]